MEEWKTVEIKEICTGIFEGPHATPKESSVGGYYLGIPAIGSDGHINFENAKRISEDDLPAWTKRVVPQEDDIVFTNEATLNLYAIIPAGFHGCLGRRLGLIRPNKDLVNVRYLFYYFFSPEWRCVIEKNKVYGATVERILMTKFPHFPVRLPGRETQDRIANILSCIDEKITLNTRINHNLEEQAQALYKSWFVDFEPFKDSKYVDSELGMVPEGWHVGVIGDIATITSGKRPNMKYETSSANHSVPVIGASSVMAYTDSVYLSEHAIITGRVGTLGIIQRINEPCWPSDNTLIIKSKFQNFLYQVLNDVDYSSLNRGSTQPLLTQSDLKSWRIIIPPIELITEFESAIKDKIRLIADLNRQNRKLSLLREILLPQLMLGSLTC
jgi:Restriction endonuclease S subunits